MIRTTIHQLLPAFIAIGVFILSACKSDPAGSDTRPPAIYGRVLDALGNPVANAGISLLFSYAAYAPDTANPLIVIAPAPAMNNVDIRFSIPASDSVTMYLLRVDTRVVAKTMINQYLQTGQYSVSIDVQDLPNQAYIVHMESSSDTVESLLVVHNPDLDDSAPLLRTDASGSFTIPYSSLPIGRLFERTYENGVSGGWVEIGNQLGIGINGPGSSNVIWNLQVNTAVVVDSTLRLP